MSKPILFMLSLVFLVGGCARKSCFSPMGGPVGIEIQKEIGYLVVTSSPPKECLILTQAPPANPEGKPTEGNK